MDTGVPVSVGKLLIARVLRESDDNALFEVSCDDKTINGQMVMIKDTHVHPVTDELMHVDFLAVNMNEKIKAEVAVELVGKPKGAEEGGILQQPNRSLEISALPNKVPRVLEVDVTGLAIGDSLHVNDITLPDGVEIVDFSNRTLAVVVAPTEEKVEEPTDVDPTAVEVTSEKKEIEGTEKPQGKGKAEGEGDKGAS
jgi:large subunit ribosomal protein L25